MYDIGKIITAPLRVKPYRLKILDAKRLDEIRQTTKETASNKNVAEKDSCLLIFFSIISCFYSGTKHT